MSRWWDEPISEPPSSLERERAAVEIDAEVGVVRVTDKGVGNIKSWLGSLRRGEPAYVAESCVLFS